MLTYKFAKLSALSIVLLSLGPAACAVQTDDEAQTTDDELSASRVQIVGTIVGGATKMVAYTASPKYRGFSYAGTKGDQITLHATAANGAVVRLYVLGVGMKTLATNSVTKGGDVHYTLKTDGTFTFTVSTQDASSTSITFTADVPNAVHAVGEAPGEACDGTLTSPGLAELFTTKSTAAGAISLGDYTRTTYTRSCSSTLGGCTAWTPVADNLLIGNTGYVLGFGDGSDFKVALRSTNVVAVDSGVPQYPCYHAIAGNGYGASVGDPALDSMIIGETSTCSNDGGPNVSYEATIVTDHCMRAMHRIETSRHDFGGGAYASTEKATVFYTAY